MIIMHFKLFIKKIILEHISKIGGIKNLVKEKIEKEL
jgi:hypothetical protein